MQFQRTEKGHRELQPGVRTLGVRERSFLLVAEGCVSWSTMQAVFGADCQQIARQLLHDEYLEVRMAKRGPARNN